MANKIDLDFTGSPKDETIKKLQTQIEAFHEWARTVEFRQHQLQEGILTMVGNFEALAGLLVSKQEVTEESITEGRNAFMDKIRELQREQAEAQKKPLVWAPNNKIVPAS